MRDKTSDCSGDRSRVLAGDKIIKIPRLLMVVAALEDVEVVMAMMMIGEDTSK
jgi:hypothetical protein